VEVIYPCPQYWQNPQVWAGQLSMFLSEMSSPVGAHADGLDKLITVYVNLVFGYNLSGQMDVIRQSHWGAQKCSDESEVSI